jgi:hypothetical protein
VVKKVRFGCVTEEKTSPIFHSWSGLAFERVCLLHSEQINKALGISGVISNKYSWCTAANEEHSSEQIDIVIDRTDHDD